jgi:hypothetical protein
MLADLCSVEVPRASEEQRELDAFLGRFRNAESSGAVAVDVFRALS